MRNVPEANIFNNTPNLGSIKTFGEGKEAFQEVFSKSKQNYSSKDKSYNEFEEQDKLQNSSPQTLEASTSNINVKEEIDETSKEGLNNFAIEARAVILNEEEVVEEVVSTIEEDINLESSLRPEVIESQNVIESKDTKITSIAEEATDDKGDVTNSSSLQMDNPNIISGIFEEEAYDKKEDPLLEEENIINQSLINFTQTINSPEEKINYDSFQGERGAIKKQVDTPSNDFKNEVVETFEQEETLQHNLSANNNLASSNVTEVPFLANQQKQEVENSEYSPQLNLQNHLGPSLTKVMEACTTSEIKEFLITPLPEEFEKSFMGNDDKASSSLFLEEIDFGGMLKTDQNKLFVSFDELQTKPQENIPHRSDQISLSIEAARLRNKSEISVNLYPEALGKVDIKMGFTKIAGEQVLTSIKIVVERPETLRLLGEGIDYLKATVKEVVKSSENASLSLNLKQGQDSNHNQPEGRKEDHNMLLRLIENGPAENNHMLPKIYSSRYQVLKSGVDIKI